MGSRAPQTSNESHRPVSGSRSIWGSRPTHEVTTHQRGHDPLKRATNRIDPSRDREPNGVTTHPWGHEPPMGSRPTEGERIRIDPSPDHDPFGGHDPPMGSRPTNGVTTHQWGHDLPKSYDSISFVFFVCSIEALFFIERPLKVTNDCWPSSSGGGSDQLTPNVQRPTANERATKKKKKTAPFFIHSLVRRPPRLHPFFLREKQLSLSLAFDFNRRLSILIRSTRPPAVGGWGWGRWTPKNDAPFQWRRYPQNQKIIIKG